MIIPSRKIPAYFGSMTFPVSILAEKDNRVMFTMDREQLLQLISKQGVTAVGSWNRIRKLRVNSMVMEEAEEAVKSSSTAFAHTNMGVFREPIRAAVVQETFGHRAAIASGEITGHVWTHCGLR